ncbi:hypothetical protein DMC30DRAFT_414361 [Rhodotorula diobovata]|uniref:Uncharacterized protein n=1 Tax=Rhodotorula diobovata TaxID=5288 RepID=A0A5C5G3X5_9BASI|nr:hypothetical protein DMC30DRAFT_414361 [Rhodotorula diobovata]
MSSPTASTSPPHPPALVLIPATPLPPPSPRLPSSPAPSSFSRRGRTPHRVARVPPPPLPSTPATAGLLLPLELGAAHVLELYLASPSPTTVAASPLTRTPPAFTLPFTSLLVADPVSPPPVVDGEQDDARHAPTSGRSSGGTGKKKHKKQHLPTRTRSRSTPARPRIPAIWRDKAHEGEKAAARGGTAEREYLKVDAKLEYAMNALGF